MKKCPYFLVRTPISLFRYPFIIVCLLLTYAKCPGAETISITDYRATFKTCRDSAGIEQIAIRQYLRNGVAHLLLVNPVNLQSTAVPTSAVTFPPQSLVTELRKTPYVRALERFTSPPYKLQNHGATHAEKSSDGWFLTVDMCPSRRAFEREMFERLLGIAEVQKKPVSMAIAITGRWLETHREELAWLVKQANAGKLAITWVNHSNHHPYDPNLPLDRNFLLTTGTDFEQEVLSTEILLLESGIVPSPFFRFPGLVADGNLLDRLRKLSLIPLGSNAWLAKGEVPKPGSFILVHGNGNEPQGIARLLALLRDPGCRPFLPLREAFVTH